MEKKKFALIGKTLKHSYSSILHERLSKCEYCLVELAKDDLKSFVQGDITAFNVTIPYKRDIIEYLDEIDEKAERIGAVNTVLKRNGKVKGYNTDYFGLKYLLESERVQIKDCNVLILGSGGTSQTAFAVVNDLGAKDIKILSRTGEINYQNCYELMHTNVIINTTPVGTYPNISEKPIDVSKFNNLTTVVDVIYNPLKTRLCFDAEQREIKAINGLKMLVAQAKKAHELFIDKAISNEEIERLYLDLKNEKQNVVLIGMPGCGKTCIGKILAERLDREFIDTDVLIEQKEGTDIPTIINNKGEKYFRALEKEVIKEVAPLTCKVISTGGGVVVDKENHFYLSANGKIFLINRDLEKLATNGRPLSSDLDALKKRYEERKDKYLDFADFEIDNNGEMENAVKGVLERL